MVIAAFQMHESSSVSNDTLVKRKREGKEDSLEILSNDGIVHCQVFLLLLLKGRILLLRFPVSACAECHC